MTVTAASKARPPIGSHPAFPAVVALWLAALLGFGSLALPGGILERLVAGLGPLAPAAESERLLIAVIAAAAGAVAGAGVARVIAAVRQRGSWRVARPRRPISASEELGNWDQDDSPESQDIEPAAPEGEPLDLGAFAELMTPSAGEHGNVALARLIERFAAALDRPGEARLPLGGERRAAPRQDTTVYASLRAMRPPPEAAAPRPDPRGTERALRAALEKLQAMSGTA